MRIFAVTPIHVGHTELARRQDRYRRMLPEDVAIELVDLDPAGPRSLATPKDVARSEEMILERFRRVPQGFDALMPDCVLDPGAERAEELALPYIGILRRTLDVVRRHQWRAAGVARNSTIAAAMRMRAASYGFDAELSEVAVLGLGVSAITDHESWTAALNDRLRELTARGYQAVINGCSAVDVDEGMATVLDPLRVTFDNLSESFEGEDLR